MSSANSTDPPSILTAAFWKALGTTLAHDDLPLVAKPVDDVLAAVQTVKADPLKLGLALASLQTELATTIPELAATTEADVAAALRAPLAPILAAKASTSSSKAS